MSNGTVTIDAFNFDDWVAPPAKIVTLKDDPVVLACAGYRMYLENPRYRWLTFDQVIIWHGDREEAIRLRAYYREKFKQTTFDMLKRTDHRKLSSFRHKLYQLVNGDLVITEKEIGLLHRLPYFYAEDRALDAVVNATESVAEHIPIHRQTLKLTLLDKILRSRHSGEINQYWFTEETNSHAYMLPVTADNNLANFFDSMITRPLNIESAVVCKQMQGNRNHLYFQIMDPKLA